MIAITFDIDWAPDIVITDTLELLSAAGISATYFATHDTSLFDRLCGHEIGIHPDFRYAKDYNSELDRLLQVYPHAKGVRCHSLYQNTQILDLFAERGLHYDSNILMYRCQGIHAFQHWNGLVRLPVFWEDDVNCLVGKTWDPGMLSLLDPNSLYVFNFHPIHVYLNTEKLERYELAKPHYHDPVKLCEFVNPEASGTGTRVFLKRLLSLVKEKHLSMTLIEFVRSLDTKLADLQQRTTLMPQTSTVETYDASNLKERADMVRANYEMRNGTEIYTTSRDFNLRELEIGFIIDNIKDYIESTGSGIAKLLDIGCGNGYTDIRIAQEVKAEIVGVDFSGEMISGAQYLGEKFRDRMLSIPAFKIGDIRDLSWDDTYFDIVISERCLLNLPDRDTQYDVIREVHRVLRRGGIYVMVEGTRNGLRRLNDLRVKLGLKPIPDRAEENMSSLKFEEEDVEEFLSKYFKIIKKQNFGMYYLISRVIHPLLVFPDAPKFDAKINEIARRIAMHQPDYMNMGHVMGLVLAKI